MECVDTVKSGKTFREWFGITKMREHRFEFYSSRVTNKGDLWFQEKRMFWRKWNIQTRDFAMADEATSNIGESVFALWHCYNGMYLFSVIIIKKNSSELVYNHLGRIYYSNYWQKWYSHEERNSQTKWYILHGLVTSELLFTRTSNGGEAKCFKFNFWNESETEVLFLGYSNCIDLR